MRVGWLVAAVAVAIGVANTTRSIPVAILSSPGPSNVEGQHCVGGAFGEGLPVRVRVERKETGG